MCLIYLYTIIYTIQDDIFSLYTKFVAQFLWLKKKVFLSFDRIYDVTNSTLFSISKVFDFYFKFYVLGIIQSGCNRFTDKTYIFTQVHGYYTVGNGKIKSPCTHKFVTILQSLRRVVSFGSSHTIK